MYTQDKIRNMIDDYKSMCNLLEEFLPEINSNSIAQYGIEATLPKPQGENNSKVESCVLTREKVTKRQRRLLDKIEFINTKQELLDDTEYWLVELLKCRKKRYEILEIMNINKNDYNNLRQKVVEDLHDLQYE